MSKSYLKKRKQLQSQKPISKYIVGGKRSGNRIASSAIIKTERAPTQILTVRKTRGMAKVAKVQKEKAKARVGKAAMANHPQTRYRGLLLTSL